MSDTEWMFDAFGYLGDCADQEGMRRLACLLELCMDVYVEEERLVFDASMVFRSRRAAEARAKRRVWPFKNVQDHSVRIVPPEWLNHLEKKVREAVASDG